MFLPSAPQNQMYSQPQQSEDMYAADEPNPRYPSLNSYEKPYFGNNQQQQSITTITPDDDFK